MGIAFECLRSITYRALGFWAGIGCMDCGGCEEFSEFSDFLQYFGLNYVYNVKWK